MAAILDFIQNFFFILFLIVLLIPFIFLPLQHSLNTKLLFLVQFNILYGGHFENCLKLIKYLIFFVALYPISLSIP